MYIYEVFCFATEVASYGYIVLNKGVEEEQPHSTHVLLEILSIVQQHRANDIDNAQVVDDAELGIEKNHTKNARQDDRYCRCISLEHSICEFQDSRDDETTNGRIEDGKERRAIEVMEQTMGNNGLKVLVDCPHANDNERNYG